MKLADLLQGPVGSLRPIVLLSPTMVLSVCHTRALN